MKTTIFFTLLALFACSRQRAVFTTSYELEKFTFSGDSAYRSAYFQYQMNQAQLPATDDSIYYVPVDEFPEPIELVKATLPDSLSSLRGETRVEVLLDSIGIPIMANILESTNPALNRPSLSAAMSSRFRPAIQKGHRVSIKLVLPYRFR